MAEMEQNSALSMVQSLLQRSIEERQPVVERRNQANQNYLGVMNMAAPDVGPVNRMVSDYLKRYGADPMKRGWDAMAQAIGGETENVQKMNMLQLQRAQAAAQEEARQADDALKDEDAYATKFIAGSKVAGMGKPPSPEQLRTVYTSARNEAAQIAKDYNFNSAAERSQWIEEQANSAVQNYLNNFATQPLGPRGLPNAGQNPATAAPQPITPEMFNPYAQQAQQPGQAPQAPATPAAAPNVARPAPNVQPVLRDKAEEERKKTYATGMEESSIKDYEENVRIPAAQADGMLKSISVLRQIPATMDAFAPYREKVGAALDALGMDGTLAREARDIQQMRSVLTKLTNDRLLLAKGVQAKDDAQRAFDEFVKIGDTKQAADFMYTWAEELANRAKFKDAVYRDAAKTSGSMGNGGDAWENTDYAQTAPVAILPPSKSHPSQFWSFTDFRDTMMKSPRNKGISLREVINMWNDIARKGKK